MSSAAELLGAEVKWEGAVIRAGVERFRHADGAEVTRDKVWHPGAVGIIPLDDEHVWLTRQPREVIGASASLEIPAGKRDVPGEPPLDTAKRELAEEIGKHAENWEELLSFYTSPGFSDERIWLYMATGLSDSPGVKGDEDERIEIVPWPLAKLDEAIEGVRGLEILDRAAVVGGAARRSRPPVSIHEEAARGFGRGADAYERGRPGYPPAAVQWLWSELGIGPGRTVLDVAAGTGKLTRELLASGATVIAVEPVAAMRAVLERVVPGARAHAGTAEALPVGDETVDAITAASAFHWFDGPAAAAEFHRALRPHGRLALLWNRRRLEQPIHRAVDEIIGPYRRRTPSHHRGEWRAPLERSGLFAAAAEREVPLEQVLDADGFVDRFSSISFVAALPDAERESVLRRLRAVAESAEQPLRLGYTTEVYVYRRA